jgi:hypothetical protein
MRNFNRIIISIFHILWFDFKFYLELTSSHRMTKCVKDAGHVGKDNKWSVIVLKKENVLKTNSMERSPSWESNHSSASQDIPPHSWNKKDVTVFIRTCHWTLSGTIRIMSTFSHPICLRSASMLSCYLRIDLSCFPTKILNSFRTVCMLHPL